MAGDEFAGLLRELKERSGLSYGVLAKRLHVSTSTLHRYVNGDAVPTDYAPVERLARACRATPEELVELHRRWVLADALRGQKGTAAGALAGASADADADADADENGDGNGEGNGDGAAVAAAVADVAADVAPETGPGSAPESGRAAGPDAGREAVAQAPVRRSRRAVALAAAGAVVVAAVASTALVVHLGSGRSDDDAKGHAVAVGVPPGARPRADSTPTGARQGSASPSASRDAGPEVSSSSVGGAVDQDTATGKGAGEDGSAEDGATAPTVVADPYKWDDPCSQHYLVNRKAAQVPPPPNEADARGWVGALGGVAGGQQMLALTVQGTGRATVVLKGLHVRVVEKNAPLAWNDFAMGVGCGGGVETKSFGVDLDAGRPVTAPKAGQRDFPYKVSESDPEVFYVFADAQAHDVSWYLELDWSSGSKSGTVRVDDHGKPFRTSGSVGRPAYDYPLGGSEWQTAAPAG
ncbi:helix-turn-helix domain-containing protein [Streptomyces sp. NBC_01571]|uniref:transcriptional regulator n=1 Tax=Streptomyces sp. NBC_01571 TaxID=2975883 RepID=UPI0022569C6D|nr:transcriptional regulator [Streptomyces sp. NBC_01571]MCX4576699.1 helix-turn-helix domain-containing protein [Streptomyces sp. NBC_01571]